MAQQVVGAALAQDFRFGEPGDSLRGLIPKSDLPLQVDEIDPVIQVIQESFIEIWAEVVHGSLSALRQAPDDFGDGVGGQVGHGAAGQDHHERDRQVGGGGEHQVADGEIGRLGEAQGAVVIPVGVEAVIPDEQVRLEGRDAGGGFAAPGRRTGRRGRRGD